MKTRIRKINLKQRRYQAKLELVQNIIDSFDKTQLHYTFYFHSATLNPFVNIARLSYLINGTAPVDHTGIINHLDFDEGRNQWNAKTLDATIKHGVIESDFKNYALNYDGDIEILEIGDVDKSKLEAFTKNFIGMPYGKVSAALASIDSKTINKYIKVDENKFDPDQLNEALKYGGNKIFCSFLDVLCAIHQGYNPNIVPQEAIPFDVYRWAKGLGGKSYFIPKIL